MDKGGYMKEVIFVCDRCGERFEPLEEGIYYVEGKDLCPVCATEHRIIIQRHAVEIRSFMETG